MANVFVFSFPGTRFKINGVLPVAIVRSSAFRIHGSSRYVTIKMDVPFDPRVFRLVWPFLQGLEPWPGSHYQDLPWTDFPLEIRLLTHRYIDQLGFHPDAIIRSRWLRSIFKGISNYKILTFPQPEVLARVITREATRPGIPASFLSDAGESKERLLQEIDRQYLLLCHDVPPTLAIAGFELVTESSPSLQIIYYLLYQLPGRHPQLDRIRLSVPRTARQFILHLNHGDFTALAPLLQQPWPVLDDHAPVPIDIENVINQSAETRALSNTIRSFVRSEQKVVIHLNIRNDARIVRIGNRWAYQGHRDGLATTPWIPVQWLLQMERPKTRPKPHQCSYVPDPIGISNILMGDRPQPVGTTAWILAGVKMWGYYPQVIHRASALSEIRSTELGEPLSLLMGEAFTPAVGLVWLWINALDGQEWQDLWKEDVWGVRYVDKLTEKLRIWKLLSYFGVELSSGLPGYYLRRMLGDVYLHIPLMNHRDVLEIFQQVQALFRGINSDQLAQLPEAVPMLNEIREVFAEFGHVLEIAKTKQMPMIQEPEE